MNDTGSGRVAVKGPITRSSRETLSKKVAEASSTTPNRKSERLEKRKTEAPSPLRRSERTRNASPSDPSASRGSGSRTRRKRHCNGKQLSYGDEDFRNFILCCEDEDGDEDEEGGRVTEREYCALFVLVLKLN